MDGWMDEWMDRWLDGWMEGVNITEFEDTQRTNGTSQHISIDPGLMVQS